MKDYITAYERTHFTLMQKLKYNLHRIFRGATC
jgi:hypothetical protein